MDSGQGDDPVDHLLQGLARGVVEVGIEPDRDEMLRRLTSRQLPTQILAHMEFESTLEGGFDRGAVYLAMSLRRMTIAGREQRPIVPHGEINGAAGHQILAVNIAAELARLLAVLSAIGLGRRDRELTEQ